MNGDEADRLKKLEERIDTFKQGQEPAPKTVEHYSAAHVGWRMVTELVAGLLIGFGIGYGLDAIFGTIPIFTVLFIFAGFAAGVKVMIKTAGELQEAAQAASGDTPEIPPADEKKEG